MNLTKKIDILATPDSGYMEFIQAISELEVILSHPANPTLVAFGRLTIRESLILYIFGKIPHPQPDYRDEFAQNHIGSILLVNASERDPKMLDIVRKNRIYANQMGAYLIAVKADTDNADDLRSRLPVLGNETFLTWNPAESDGVKKIFLELLKGLPESEEVKAIIARIENLHQD